MCDRRHPVRLLFQTSIGHLSWPKSASIFFDQCRWIMFFCRGWLMFSLPSKWKHAGVGRNTTSVPLERKNLADLRCKFLRRHNKKASSIVKETLSASVCKKKKKNCAMSAEKYQSRLYSGRCRPLCFLFNPWIIFGWCPLGNVRSAPSGEASFPNLDRSSFLADVGLHCFRSVPVNHIFFSEVG